MIVRFDNTDDIKTAVRASVFRWLRRDTGNDHVPRGWQVYDAQPTAPHFPYVTLSGLSVDKSLHCRLHFHLYSMTHNARGAMHVAARFIADLEDFGDGLIAFCPCTHAFMQSHTLPFIDGAMLTSVLFAAELCPPEGVEYVFAED